MYKTYLRYWKSSLTYTAVILLDGQYDDDIDNGEIHVIFRKPILGMEASQRRIIAVCVTYLVLNTIDILYLKAFKNLPCKIKSITYHPSPTWIQC